MDGIIDAHPHQGAAQGQGQGVDVAERPLGRQRPGPGGEGQDHRNRQQAAQGPEQPQKHRQHPEGGGEGHPGHVPADALLGPDREHRHTGEGQAAGVRTGFGEDHPQPPLQGPLALEIEGVGPGLDHQHLEVPAPAGLQAVAPVLEGVEGQEQRVAAGDRLEPVAEGGQKRLFEPFGAFGQTVRIEQRRGLPRRLEAVDHLGMGRIALQQVQDRHRRLGQRPHPRHPCHLRQPGAEAAGQGRHRRARPGRFDEQQVTAGEARLLQPAHQVRLRAGAEEEHRQPRLQAQLERQGRPQRHQQAGDHQAACHSPRACCTRRAMRTRRWGPCSSGVNVMRVRSPSASTISR